MGFWERTTSDRRSGPGFPWALLSIVLLTVVPAALAIHSHFADEAIVAPTTRAADKTVELLAPTTPVASQKPLPVWPPPKSTQPADPAANAMIGAPPQRVQWPAGRAKGDAGTH
ncbi:MAG: hypothetical protein ABI551_04185 [Polyangiaceae bacterium]